MRLLSPVLQMAAPSGGQGEHRATRRERLTSDPGGSGPKRLATWASVIGPILSQILGAAVILYEVLNEVNNPAALGVGLTLAIGGKFADVLAELLKPQ